MTQTILDRVPPPADARIQYGDGALQFADLRVPEGVGSHPCVIAIHGGFWRNRYGLDHLGHLCAALTEQQFATWNIEYRRVGDPGGGWPGTFHDVAAAARHLFDNAAELQIDPARVIVLGHSAGGHLASWLASMEHVPVDSLIRSEPLPFRATVPLAGVLDLRACWELNLSNGAVLDFLGGTPEDVPDHYTAASPAELLPSGVPHLLVHGTEDENVPVTMSETYHAASICAGGSASFLALPGTDHFDVIDPESRVWPEIAAAILALMNDSFSIRP